VNIDTINLINKVVSIIALCTIISAILFLIFIKSEEWKKRFKVLGPIFVVIGFLNIFSFISYPTSLIQLIITIVSISLSIFSVNKRVKGNTLLISSFIGLLIYLFLVLV
jgi:hypothetical protein